MNSIESAIIPSPYNKDEECAKFVIDDNNDIFILPGIMLVGDEYTFSCWIQSVDTGSIEVNGAAFETAAEWSYETHTFTADRTDLGFIFPVSGTYYLYHPQLELGNHATDWTPSPEDVDESIRDTADAIRVEMNTQYANIVIERDQIIQTVRDECVRVDDFETYKEDVSSKIEQTASDLTMTFTESVESIRTENGETQSEINEIKKYFQFNADGLEIGSGNPDDPHKVVIDNDMIAIMAYNEPVQEFLATGEAKIPRPKITKSMWLLGYQIDTDESGYVSCEYVGDTTPETEEEIETIVDGEE